MESGENCNDVGSVDTMGCLCAAAGDDVSFPCCDRNCCESWGDAWRPCVVPAVLLEEAFAVFVFAFELDQTDGRRDAILFLSAVGTGGGFIVALLTVLTAGRS